MSRRCSCRSPLSENDLFAASSIGVRIEHDAEPCLPNESGEAERAVADEPWVATEAATRSPDSTSPVLTRLPRLTVVGAK